MLKPGFVEPMECQSAEKLPTGSGWLYEIKLDGYRMIAVRNAKTALFPTEELEYEEVPRDRRCAYFPSRGNRH